MSLSGPEVMEPRLLLSRTTHSPPVEVCVSVQPAACRFAMVRAPHAVGRGSRLIPLKTTCEQLPKHLADVLARALPGDRHGPATARQCRRLPE
jgi:hypothetical protein